MQCPVVVIPVFIHLWIPVQLCPEGPPPPPKSIKTWLMCMGNQYVLPILIVCRRLNKCVLDRNCIGFCQKRQRTEKLGQFFICNTSEGKITARYCYVKKYHYHSTRVNVILQIREVGGGGGGGGKQIMNIFSYDTLFKKLSLTRIMRLFD